jgi:hypothetical protein
MEAAFFCAEKNMVPDKTRRQKRVLGILKRILAIREARRGHTLGAVRMFADIDRKVFWRMRKVIIEKDDA